MASNFVEGEHTRHAAAVLRVVLTLKRTPQLSLDDAIARVVRETGVEPIAFRSFMASNMEVIARSVRRR